MQWNYNIMSIILSNKIVWSTGFFLKEWLLKFEEFAGRKEGKKHTGNYILLFLILSFSKAHKASFYFTLEQLPAYIIQFRKHWLNYFFSRVFNFETQGL